MATNLLAACNLCSNTKYSDPYVNNCPCDRLKRWRVTASKVAAFIICLILCLHGAYANALQSEPPVKEVDPVRPALVLPQKLVLQANAAGPIQDQKQPPLIGSTALTRLIIIVAPLLGLMIVVAIFCWRKQNGGPVADAADPVRPNVTYNFSIIGSLCSAA